MEDKSNPTEQEFESRFKDGFTPKTFLGTGAYGSVFEVDKILIKNRDMKMKCAVKRIPIEGRQRETSRDKALREVDALLKLNHEGIVNIQDAWIEDPPPGWQRDYDGLIFQNTPFENIEYKNDCSFLYIQMELCQYTLEDWISSNEPRDMDRIEIWFKQIVSAVDYIHEMGYIHRDLKPSNILFSSKDRLKVCDLGIIADSVIKNESANTDGTGVSKGRTLQMGSPLYMAPEQRSWTVDTDEPYTSKVDIFALGLILTELCVEMTKDVKEKVFRDYQCGKGVTILHHLPDVNYLVNRMTNKDPFWRPDCNQILEDDLFENKTKIVFEERIREAEFQSEFQNKFEVLSLVGAGGFGAVFSAKHSMDSCTYAVKRIACRDERALERKLNGARLHATLRDDGIIRYHTLWNETPPEGWQHDMDYKTIKKFDNFSEGILHYRDDCSFLYIQMEMCEYSLKDWLSGHDKRDLSQTKVWFKQIVSAVAYIHNNQLIHRNLKPGNILFGMDGRLKLSSLVHCVEQHFRNGEEVQENRDCTYTPMYAAPEQGSCFPFFDSKVDIFTLGLILIEMCTVLKQNEACEIFDRIRLGASHELLDHLPEEVGKFVAWLTNVDPAYRPTAKEILAHELMT